MSFLSYSLHQSSRTRKGLEPNAPRSFHPVVPWLFCSLVVWDNIINLYLNAPYTSDFLFAPFFLAISKALCIAFVALIFDFAWLWTGSRGQSLGTLTYQESILAGLAPFEMNTAPTKPKSYPNLYNLFAAWFLSSVSWGGYLFVANSLLKGAPDKLFKFLSGGADATISYANIIRVFWSYFAEGLIFLVISLGVTLFGITCWRLISTKRGAPFWGSPRSAFWFTVCSVLYCVLNSAFAILVRI